MKNWKPKINKYVWVIDVSFTIKYKFTEEKSLKKWHKDNLLFRTKALAQSALRDVKKVLKKARKA